MGLGDFFPALLDNYFIKLIFLVHAILISLATLAIQPSSITIGYVFYNSIFLIIVLLAILVDKSADIALVGSIFDGACIILDILLFVSHDHPGVLGILIVVLNLVLRVLTTVLLLRIYSARAGVEDPTRGFLEVNVQNAPRARSAYQDIDEPSQALP
uniref:Uncharacterized protein n=1 Tax=Aceria tosichella TaxID=561515 RepID=A0A6G1SPQ0_9ACAR